MTVTIIISNNYERVKKKQNKNNKTNDDVPFRNRASFFHHRISNVTSSSTELSKQTSIGILHSIKAAKSGVTSRAIV